MDVRVLCFFNWNCVESVAKMEVLFVTWTYPLCLSDAWAKSKQDFHKVNTLWNSTYMNLVYPCVFRWKLPLDFAAGLLNFRFRIRHIRFRKHRRPTDAYRDCNGTTNGTTFEPGRSQAIIFQRPVVVLNIEAFISTNEVK